jgi:micrococcal nuclease
VLSILPASVAAVIAALALSACAGGQASAAVEEEAASVLHPKGPVVTGARVDRVVDGDTIHVVLDGRDVTVRMIGINTPETVKPGAPVECFGPESSAFATSALAGRTVSLEFDSTQGRTDQYGRTLAYVWIERPAAPARLFNLAAIAGGYAFERQYGPTPYAWKSQFRAAAKDARADGRGLWGACPYS